MNSPPLWLALLGSGIAALAAVMAVAQWRTNHQRVVLDLFDRRFAIYDPTGALMGRILTTGRAPLNDIVELESLRARAQFLFGPDVIQFLDKLVQNCGALEKANLVLETLDTPDRTEAAQRRQEAFWAIKMQFSELSAVAARYMRMDQKRVRSFREWVRDSLRWIKSPRA
jgi:hypothetical protein